jgi:uncharacterized protein
MLAILLIGLLLPAVALAAALPALTGRVVDQAGMLDAATRILLEQKLADFEKEGSDQIVVATVEDLDGEAIEPYANRLFRDWKLGQAGENNGVLLLISRDDRKMRIEVGYGLEGTLTDLHSRLIIENDLVPAFRAGDFSGGIEKAVDDIIMVLHGNPEELEARGRRNPASSNDIEDWIPVLFITIWAILFFGGFAMAILPPIFGEKIGPGRYRGLGLGVVVIRRGRWLVVRRRWFLGRRRLVRRRRRIWRLVDGDETHKRSRPRARGCRHSRGGGENRRRNLLRRRPPERRLLLSRRLHGDDRHPARQPRRRLRVRILVGVDPPAAFHPQAACRSGCSACTVVAGAGAAHPSGAVADAPPCRPRQCTASVSGTQCAPHRRPHRRADLRFAD